MAPAEIGGTGPKGLHVGQRLFERRLGWICFVAGTYEPIRPNYSREHVDFLLKMIQQAMFFKIS